MAHPDPKLIARWSHEGRNYRLIADGGKYLLERQSRSALGIELWETAGSMIGLRDGGFANALCAGIESLANEAATRVSTK